MTEKSYLKIHKERRPYTEDAADSADRGDATDTRISQPTCTDVQAIVWGLK